MSWNDCLSYYHTQVGGTYYGSREEDGILVLEHRGIPMVLCACWNGAGRGSTVSFQARSTLELERHYHLKIRPAGLISKGLGAVRTLNPHHQDYGFPQLTKKRNITGDDAPLPS